MTQRRALPFGPGRLGTSGLPRYGLDSGVVAQLLPAAHGERRPLAYGLSSISMLFLKLLQKGKEGYWLIALP